uniref:Centrosomal protein of 290 kDa-like n=1 Tax=Diabrotica virgifera virgifera TaxID=50390 RepID=A0A6P7GZ07_DIAVI
MSSDELKDEGKRMRKGDEEGEKGDVKKSRQMDTTTRKGSGVEREDEMMEILKQLALNLREENEAISLDVKDIKSEQRIYAEELKELRAENQKLREENEAIRKESEQTKKQVRELSTRLDYLEKEKKKDNVIVTGLDIDAEEPEMLKLAMGKKVEETLQIQQLRS